jgi:hypothetical protein
MNKKINISRIFAFGLVLAGLSGCFDSGSNPNGDSGTPGSMLTVSGRVDLSNAASASVRVAVRGVVGIPDASGKYSISVPAFATRSFDDGSVIDTARIIVDGDTLREVPLTSWSTVLPTNYVVQRNIGVKVGNTTDVLEAVWWTNDSIANTIQLGKDGVNRSGFIYTVYDDSMYARDAHLYWLFVRVKTSGANNANGADSILKYSDVHDVTAKSGNQSFDASKFEVNTRIKTLGYSLVPQDSSVRVYTMTRTVVMVLDSIVKLDTIEMLNNDTAAQNVFNIPLSFVRDTLRNIYGDTVNLVGIGHDSLYRTSHINGAVVSFNALRDVRPGNIISMYYQGVVSLVSMDTSKAGPNTLTFIFNGGSPDKLSDARVSVFPEDAVIDGSVAAKFQRRTITVFYRMS